MKMKKSKIDIFSLAGHENDKEVKGPLLLLGYFGYFLIVIGILILLPLALLIFYPSEANEYLAYLIPGAGSVLVGIVFFSLIFKRPHGKLTTIEDLILVIGVWILAIILSAIPFFFYGYDFTQSLFEATSGYTSAGLTIMNWSKEVKTLSDGTTDVVSHLLFFHRTLSQLVGGIGLVLVVASAISERSGLNIYLLEGHNDKLLPNLAKSARLIFSLYLGFIAIGSVCYIAVGVKPFDAICHSMTAVATGGFSTKSNNVNQLVLEISAFGAWRGYMVEIITAVLCLLGGTSFVIHYSLLRGKIKVLKHYEFVVGFVTLVIVWPIMIVGMTEYFNGDVGAGFRYGTLEMISAVTAGFQFVDSYQAHAVTGTIYAATSSAGLYGFSQLNGSLSTVEIASGYAEGNIIKFPTYLLFILGFLMMCGMQNGSTSGAIKQGRIAMLFKDIGWRIQAAIGKPERYKVHTTYKYGIKTRIEQEEVTEAETFIALYATTVLIGTVLIAVITYACGITRGDGTGTAFTFSDVFFEFASAVGTIGLGAGITSYANSLTAGGIAILWIEIVGMILGRLEIYVFFTLGGKIIYRIRNGKYIYKSEKNSQKANDYIREEWTEENLNQQTHDTHFDFRSKHKNED